jgi:hypothetical protein
MKLRVVRDAGVSAVPVPQSVEPAPGGAGQAAREAAQDAARESAGWEQRVHKDVMEFRRSVKDDRLLHSLRDVLPSR